MNQILIWEPRWHDKVVLVAEHRLLPHNEIIIQHKDFPGPYYLTDKRAREFPLEEMKTQAGGLMPVRAVPLEELQKELIDV